MQSALRLKPTFTDAYNNLASALVQKGMIPAALQCYQAALQINPNLVSESRSGAIIVWSRLMRWGSGMDWAFAAAPLCQG